uniref:Uncharacterized protein n=1 Tax=Oryza sativa subsp. japonica TaxID=39947 RepID=Q5Z7T9_ORYSJ|nr:hypothetical protein [Oryza sativa Japonica Group]
MAVVKSMKDGANVTDALEKKCLQCKLSEYTVDAKAAARPPSPRRRHRISPEPPTDHRITAVSARPPGRRRRGRRRCP